MNDVSPLLIVALFTTLAIPWWCFVVWMISFMSGWQRLAAAYPALDEPSGERFGMEGARIGLANYKGCLVVHSSPGGLHLSVWTLFRPGHAPLFIPWSAMHRLRRRQLFWLDTVVFDVGEPTIATLQLSKKVMSTMPGFKLETLPQ
jgi:hypothetical protein